ncbi:MAG: Gfo/Idh/MocA family oxidoreductase [Chloroflexi bacterium]|nr:Gfo/Idh/MocA family oxidoreductase [Chloroflexota bacterium]
MEKMQLAIVGCGGMGYRHLRGLRALEESGHNPFELVGCCDTRADNAAYVADEAEKALGKRPRTFGTIAEMKEALPELQAVDVTTPNGTHHVVVQQAFDAGLHVLCEKPMALTIRGANIMIEAWKKSGKVLSVAENFRRDPICRLTKALLDAGVIGKPYVLFHTGAGSGNGIIIVPNRHDKYSAGFVTSSGVHTTDLMMYYLGDIEEVFARTKQWEPIRYKKNMRSVSSFYAHWQAEIPDEVHATAEDTLISVFTYKSGALGQWTVFLAGHGKGFSFGGVYGSEGSLRLPGPRSGQPVIVHRDDVGEIPQDKLLEYVPDFHLDEKTATLFGADRLTSYEGGMDFSDAAIIAQEYWELGDCILTGKQPEVNPYVGRRDLAAVYAAHESNVINRPVTLDEIEAETTAVYEQDINEYWGI